ncbi:hypothetical protein HW555_009113 [Spodoptera exigua]|uniref:Lipase domain-containing protein n=1 Tax=Spodoptera exigua TaxID=7107 RepID=A0A835GDN6_SPOEX|nr:hypothetical protein HW555_009113 [Spodoptera exigua]
MFKLAIVLAALAVIRAEDGVSNKYYLYTLENQYEPEILDPTAPFSRYSNFKITDNTVILVHGHQGHLNSNFDNLIKDAILYHQEPHNVIVVDWAREAGQGYSDARKAVPLVADHLANFITWLENEARLIRSTLHLVGFNLGAHIVGQAGRRLDQGLGRIGRITGLDPAASRWGSDSGRLADTDAMYVEVIHTDITGPGSNGIGTAIGDINFFVNGGSNQPGCIGHVCNHNRAYEVFAASMSNSGLLGYPCSSDLQNTLNRCKGDPLHMGGLALSKTGNGEFTSMIPNNPIPDLFKPAEQTIFLIHGYNGNTVRFNREVREAILRNLGQNNDDNVIEVDWTQGMGSSYTQARLNVENVANELVTFIQWLTTPPSVGVPANAADMHLVGFDLGAHVAGIAGLNPAGRQWGAGSRRLYRGDAKYVEVIHTDTLGALAYGIGDPIGNVNFYVNGGNNQPGCILHSCCHDRSFELFAASMSNPNLRGYRCSSMTQMNLNLCRGDGLELGGTEISKGVEISSNFIYRINTRRPPFN